jgi:hypothetical protein
MCVDKHIPKLAHAGAESESVEQLIGATPGRRTAILSGDRGSRLKFRGRCVLHLVWIAP